ncbi:MAG TPA: DUF2171 domain-containing protein [Pseudolabrys sp.]|nr:DUF2171 domain-containing protein [Pseudolabrys sp.]
MVNAQDIKEHMEVCGSDGEHVGTIDCTKDDQIILTKSDSRSGGEHHVIPLAWVSSVDEKVRLNKPAKDAIAGWHGAG